MQEDALERASTASKSRINVAPPSALEVVSIAAKAADKPQESGRPGPKNSQTKDPASKARPGSVKSPLRESTDTLLIPLGETFRQNAAATASWQQRVLQRIQARQKLLSETGNTSSRGVDTVPTAFQLQAESSLGVGPALPVTDMLGNLVGRTSYPPVTSGTDQSLPKASEAAAAAQAELRGAEEPSARFGISLFSE